MHLTLHLTRACNLRCDYCYAPPETDPGMCFAVGQQALEFGAKLTSGSCGIVFFGGEPLLHTDLVRRLVHEGRQLKEQGRATFHWKITTNGLLLDDAFLDFSLEHDILISISVDGIREAHDRHRHLAGGAPSFDFVLPKMRRLLAVRPYCSLLMVVNPDTACYLAESTAFLLNEGCRYLVVSPNYAGAWTDADLAELQRQYEQLAELYIEWTLAGRKFYFSPFDVKLASHIQGEQAKCGRCELGQRQISVDPEGFLYPCVQFTTAGPKSRWCIGHVTTGLDEELRANLYAESQREKQPCCNCAIRHRCQNSCGCLNWQTTGRIDRVSGFLCRHEQMLLRIADRVGETLYQKGCNSFLQKHYDPAYPLLSLLEDTLMT